MNHRHVVFSGVGGTGKTTTLAELRRLVPDLMVMESVSRRYYELHGVSDERAFWSNLKPADQAAFQLGLLQFYLSSFDEARFKAGTRTLVAERSVFDHAAYTIYSSPDLTRAQYDAIINQLDDHARYVRIVSFPYPVPWEIEDGFRDVRVGKNAAVAGITEALVARTFEPLITMPRSLTAAQRAEQIALSYQL